MHENLKQKEIDFICAIHNPIFIKECLFPENLKACHTWDDEDCRLVKIRNYQMAWQNYSWMLVDDNALSKKENFRKKQLAGTCYNIGCRNTGKSYDFIQMDSPVNIILNAGRESCLGSATSGFLKKVANPILNIMRDHSFFKIFQKTGKSQGIRGGEDIEIQSKNGHTFYGRNEKISDPEPGQKFQGLHYDTLAYEEFSYATEKGEEKRIDSGSSLGVIERFSGIPDIKIGSPLGNILYQEDNKKFICQLPQYIRADWDDNRRKDMIDKYKGESSMSFKLNVIGEKIEGASGFWDIERLKKKSLNKDRKIKQFDIDKKRFKNFKQHIIIDRLPAQQIFCCADIGAGARPTEIIIVFYNGKKYKLVYNIILNKLTARESAKIFAYIYKKLGGCFIGIDATTDYGIADYLKKDYDFIDNKHIFSIDLRKNIDIDFEKNEKTGRVLRDKKGNPIVKQMIAIDWAMQRLENLFYEGQMDIPLDNKFFKEFSGFKVLQTGLRKSYGSSTTDDYHQAFQIFAITQWNNEWETLINKNNSDSSEGCLGIM
jgi:hypothetical protein